MRTILRAALLLCAAASGLAQSQDGAATAASSASVDFATQAALAGLAEVEAGTLALKRSEDADIREFAKLMVEDHSRANSELEVLCKGLDIPLPPRLTGRSVVDALPTDSGATFDRTYALEVAQDHTKAVALFTKAAKSTAIDKALRQFASRTLPTLQHHYQMAEKLAQRKGGTRSDGAP